MLGCLKKPDMYIRFTFPECLRAHLSNPKVKLTDSSFKTEIKNMERRTWLSISYQISTHKCD